MKRITIKEPIWSKKAIGIATWKVTDNLIISISYVNKHGIRIFPYDYFIEKEKVIKYPIMQLKNNVTVYIVPIKDLKIYKKETNNKNNKDE